MHEYVYHATWIFKFIPLLCYIDWVVMWLDMGYGYIASWYQSKASNIRQVWARDNSKFDKFIVASFYFAINLGKMVKSEWNPQIFEWVQVRLHPKSLNTWLVT